MLNAGRMLRVFVVCACVAASLAVPSVKVATADAAASVRDAGTRRNTLDIAKAEFKNWNTALGGALSAKDASKVVALYSTEANFLSYLPLTSGDHIKTTAGTTDYFVEFVKKNPSATLGEDFFLKFDDNAFLHSGMYDIKMGDAGKETSSKGRFTYVWKKSGNDWKITHHHESALPAKGRRSGSDLDQAAEETTPFAEAFALAAKAAAEAAALPASRRKDAVTAQAEFKKWNDALLSKKTDSIKALYTDAAGELSVLPQDSPDHIKDKTALNSYLESFVKKNPNCIITDELVQAYNDNKIFLHSGLYHCFLGEMSKQVATASRFSFVWKNTNTGSDAATNPTWKIVHHHSSVVPVPPCTLDDMKKKATENFKSWNDALVSKDPKKINALYTTNTAEFSFLPTDSPDHIKAPQGAEDYFREFVKKNPSGTITDEVVQYFDTCKAYLHTGKYTFTMDDTSGLSARFSYMWKLVGKEWKITHHHSSVNPPPSAASDATRGMQDFIARLAIAALAMAALAAVAAMAAAALAASKPAAPKPATSTVIYSSPPPISSMPFSQPYPYGM